MKKLILNSTFDKGEVLSRAQLKKVIGGKGTIIDANCDNECWVDLDCQAFNLGHSCVSYADEKCGYIKICQ